MTYWTELSAEAAFASHRLIGWIYWDPVAIKAYEDLGIENGLGYYVATRGASLGNGGNAAVTAAFYSIHPDFVAMSLDLCRAATTFESAADARNIGVVAGLESYVPEIRSALAELGEPLWAAADELPLGGRALFASLREVPRSEDPVLSAWLAVNCIREWRGDTHWALQIANDLSGTEAGILDGAWRSYGDDWLPRSRGAADPALAAGYERLAEKGFVTDGQVNNAGKQFREDYENTLDRLCAPAWQSLGEDRTRQFIDLMNEAGDTLVSRIDATAGEKWMPAGRKRSTDKGIS